MENSGLTLTPVQSGVDRDPRGFEIISRATTEFNRPLFVDFPDLVFLRIFPSIPIVKLVVDRCRDRDSLCKASRGSVSPPSATEGSKGARDALR